MHHCDGPLHPDLTICRKFRFLKFDQSCIRIDNEKDCFAYLKIRNRAVPVKIKNIVEDERRNHHFVFKKFIDAEDLLPHLYPLKSSDIDIHKVSKFSDSLDCSPIEAFECKAVYLPLKANKTDEGAIFPLITESRE